MSSNSTDKPKNTKLLTAELNKEKIEKPNAFECVVASFRNLSAEEQIKDAVIYFWESHKKDDCDDKEKMQATVDLITKKFDLASCERYEVRTGYLSRYNYLLKPINESSPDEIKEAISKGEDEENGWIKQYGEYIKPLGFIEKNWQECIGGEGNPYFNSCEELIKEKMESNETFRDAFSKSVNDYIAKYGTNESNGNLYIIEENTWILSLPLLHLSKPIYLVHVGNDNSAIRTLFNQFPSLQAAVKWLSPHFSKKTFINEVDFQLEYRNRHDLGYSYAIHNKEVVSTIAQLKKDKSLTKETLLRFLEHERAEKDLLSNIIRKMPGHVYWLNRDNVYLGCNELQAKHFNLNSPSEVVGKTNYDLPVSEQADELNKINKAVMETGVPYQGEEPATMHNGFGYYLSNKIPLFDGHGKIVGLLGSSIDITDRKEKERLHVETETQKLKISEQGIFKKEIGKLVHDVSTPLGTIQMILEAVKALIPESNRLSMLSATGTMRGLFDNLRNRYRGVKDENQDPKPTIISLLLSQAAEGKKVQITNAQIEFIYDFDDCHFSFINVNQLALRRSITNLINNAVDAMDRKGTIHFSLNKKDGSIKLTIKDNGKGMPQEVLDKLRKNIAVTSGKEDGHGIGFTQIRETIDKNNGTLDIDSVLNQGTTVTITFPEIESPSWIIKELCVNQKDILVILDDDTDIHGAWDAKFQKYDVSIKHFTIGSEAVDFINSFSNKSKIFLLADFELLDQELSGVDVIRKTCVRSVLVTSHYGDEFVLKLVMENNIKILPKQLAAEVKIFIDGSMKA